MTPVAPDLYLYPRPGATVPGVDAEPRGAAALISQATDDESDEDTLEQLALRIQEAHAAVERASAAVVAFAVRAGQLLLKARDRVPPGSWGAWLDCNCKFSVRTAQAYMRVARGFNEGVVDPQHAAQSLRQVLFALQKSRVTGGESREFADWSAYPGELVPDLIAWDKARRRFVGLTKQLDEVGFARADPKSRAMFRQLVRDTIAAIWKYTARGEACS